MFLLYNQWRSWTASRLCAESLHCGQPRCTGGPRTQGEATSKQRIVDLPAIFGAPTGLDPNLQPEIVNIT